MRFLGPETKATGLLLDSVASAASGPRISRAQPNLPSGLWILAREAPWNQGTLEFGGLQKKTALFLIPLRLAPLAREQLFQRGPSLGFP